MIIISTEDVYKLPVGSEEDRITHIVSWFYGAESSPIGIDTTPPHSGANEKCINYYITDDEGSIIAISDSLGNIIKTYEYDDFGNRIETSSESSSPNPHTEYNPLGFLASYQDMEIPIEKVNQNPSEEEIAKNLYT